MSFRFLILTVVLIVGMTASACQEDEIARCTDLETLVETHEADLPRDCIANIDCFVVEVRPSRFAAVSGLPRNPEFEATVSSYARSCEQPAPRRNVFSAACIDVAAPSGESVRQQCALMFDGVVIVDQALFEPPPGIECDCAAHAHCAPNELCQGNCECKPACDAACSQAASCGETGGDILTELGFGTDVETCIAVCEVNYTDPALQTQVECLASASCSEVAGCVP